MLPGASKARLTAGKDGGENHETKLPRAACVAVLPDASLYTCRAVKSGPAN